MKSSSFIHVLGIFATILYLFSFWTSALRVVFQDRSEDAIPKCDLEPLESEESIDAQLIPKILHQVFNMWDNGSIPESWVGPRDSCLNRNQDYEYMLWNYTSARDLIATKYPWFLNTFDGYKFPVQRADAIRYFILVEYGGVYLDLDTGCAQNLDPLLEFPAFVAAAPTLGLTNSIMGAMPNHPFFEKAITSLKEYDKNWVLPYLTIMNSAGPHFLSEVWAEYLDLEPPEEEESRVRLLMSDERQGKEWSMFYSVRGASWHNWDNLIFVFIHNHVILVVFSITILLIAGACCIWWAVWQVLSKIMMSYSVRFRIGSSRRYEPDLPMWMPLGEEHKGSRVD